MMPRLRSLAALAAAIGVSAAAGAQSAPGAGGWNDVQPAPLNIGGAAAPRGSANWHDHGGWTAGGWADDPMAAGDTRAAYPAPPVQASAPPPIGYQQPPAFQQGPAFAPPPPPMIAPRPGVRDRLGRGATLPRFWMSPSYQVSNWRAYGLGRPSYRRHWVRYYDAAVLVDDRGTVIDVIDRVDWDHPAFNESYAARGEVNAYGGQAVGSYYAPAAPVAAPRPVFAPPPPAQAYAPPAAVLPAPVVTYGNPTVTTTTVVGAGPVITYATPMVATAAYLVSAPVVTTTTTTTTSYEDEVSYRTVRVAPRRTWHRPARHVVCCCACTR